MKNIYLRVTWNKAIQESRGSAIDLQRGILGKSQTSAPERVTEFVQDAICVPMPYILVCSWQEHKKKEEYNTEWDIFGENDDGEDANQNNMNTLN